jgi:chemotaxis protein MotA
MDIATFFGIILGLFVVAGSILTAGASFATFYDVSSIVVVMGGSMAAVLVCAPFRSCLGLLGVVRKAFFNAPDDISELIKQIVVLAETARRDGLLALEGKLSEIEQPFIVLGLQMAVDGTPPDVIESVMRTEIEAVSARHREGKFILDQLGRFAPAFGMIGTLLGLVMMLKNMDDPEAIGPGMAVAILTTLYGAVLANLVFLPLAEKLAFIHRQEARALEVIVRGIMCIQSGDNPRIVEQKLCTFVPAKVRALELDRAA